MTIDARISITTPRGTHHNDRIISRISHKITIKMRDNEDTQELKTEWSSTEVAVGIEMTILFKRTNKISEKSSNLIEPHHMMIEVLTSLLLKLETK